MFIERGFSLIEVLVALLIGVLLVVVIGVLGGNLIRHHANADSTSAAMNLAQWKLENLRAQPNLNPDPGACPAHPLCDGSHGPEMRTETGAESVAGPYFVSWKVFDNEPYDLPDVKSKRVIVTVVHDNNPFVRSELETYLQVTQVGEK